MISHIKDRVKESSTEAHIHTLLKLENLFPANGTAIITAMQRWERVGVSIQRVAPEVHLEVNYFSLLAT